ncbi:chemoreceptor glutamine deamidase CheD [Endothiovibrio diazotrophicus]
MDRQGPHPPKRPLKGFGHINRYWDPLHDVYTAKILPGEYYVTLHEEAVVTVLGSCVSACVRDRVFGIGGMNHFMLPSSAVSPGASDAWRSSDLSDSTRYGNFAMEHLINDILKNGGRRENLEVKVFGGGRILAQMTDIGRRNIAFVHDYLHTEGLRLSAEDVGDIYPRKVYFFPTTGKVRVKKLRSLHNNTILARENAYLDALKQQPVEGEIELF